MTHPSNSGGDTKKVQFRVSFDDLDLLASVRDANNLSSLSQALHLLVENERTQT